MKNIFDYLLTGEGTINEEVFASFSNWMFEGNDEANELARHFLRWSILFMVMSSDEGKPDNSNFYSFFQEFDRTDFDSFLSHIARYAEIAVLIEQTLGSDQPTRYSGDNQSTYWYFFGKVMNHVESKNLFPDQAENDLISPVTAEDTSSTVDPDKAVEGLSDEELRNVSRIFGVIFVIFLAAFVFFNLFL